MATRHEQSLWVLPELWMKVMECCSVRHHTLSSEVERYCELLLTQEWDVPYQTNRQITSYILKAKFSDEFPLERKRITLNLDLIDKLLDIVKTKLQTQYGVNHSLSKSDVVMMVLYMYSKDNGIYLEKWNFFDDNYFDKKFVLRVDRIYEKISELEAVLGRLPTSREYANAGGDASLSYLKSFFGSYSKALDSYLTFVSRKSSS